MEIISISCDPNTDPKTIHIVVQVGGVYRNFDVPEPIYAEIFGPLGWPPNPCE